MIRNVTIGLAILVGCLIAYRVGVGVTAKAYAEGLSETQAILAFNYMRQFEDLLQCLEKGAVEPTAERLRHAIVREKQLVAEFLRETDSDKINDYVAVRYDNPIDELKHQEGQLGGFSLQVSGRSNSAFEQDCGKRYAPPFACQVLTSQGGFS